jgi:hypothetical protein
MRKKLISNRRAYRVDILTTIGIYAEYTTRKGVGLAFAKSLVDGLKRQGAPGRLVEVPTEIVMDEWDETSKTTAEI